MTREAGDGRDDHEPDAAGAQPGGADVPTALTVPSAGALAFTESTVRRWLSSLRQPDRLADPDLTALLRAHGRLPAVTSTVAVGQAARDLIVQAIDRLRPGEGSPSHQQIPYLVLKTCFVDGAKRESAADRLGMSTRQLTRERSRAIKLLIDELTTSGAAAETRTYRPEPIPAIIGFLPRPGVTRTLNDLLAAHRIVHVHGPKGAGKTSLVAELAAEAARRTPVFWYRFRAGVNTTLGAVSFELGEYLRAQGRPALASYISEALPAPDLGIVSRIAIRDLSDVPQLLVIDDEHVAEDDPGIIGFLEEAAARLPDIRVLTVGRHRVARAVGGELALPPMTRLETQTLLVHLDVRVGPVMAEALHTWTEGLPHLVTLAAAWVKSSTPDEVAEGISALRQRQEVQDFLLDAISELLDSADRAILDAASVFRDRFTDGAVAFVSGQRVGAVEDTSRRLVRRHLATRSRQGDVAFFHASVREFFYARLTPERAAPLHARAADWYAEHGNAAEAAYHLGCATR